MLSYISVAYWRNATMAVEQKIMGNKLSLLQLAEQCGSVSQACRIFGYLRDRFYRFKEF
jgi:molybdenum-dependent DNA-binding transcriptional regulator ModE